MKPKYFFSIIRFAYRFMGMPLTISFFVIFSFLFCYTTIVQYVAWNNNNENEARFFRVSIISDIDHCPSRAPVSSWGIMEFLRDADRRNSDLIISLGDNASHRLRNCSETGDMDARYIANTLRLSGRPAHFVLGDHDIASDINSYAAWLVTTGQNKTYYSFDIKDVHVVLLDTVLGGEPMSPPCRDVYECADLELRMDHLASMAYAAYRKKYADSEIVPANERKKIAQLYETKNTNINQTRSATIRDKGRVSQSELEWLEKDLQNTSLEKVLILSDHPLFPFELPRKKYSVVNGQKVRNILENSGKNIVAVSGEAHTWHEEIREGIHYYIVDEFRKANGSWAFLEWNENAVVFNRVMENE